MLNLTTLKAYLTGFTLGSVVASSIALLFAPYSGEETRQLLLVRSEKAKDKTKKFIKETQKNADQLLTQKTKEVLNDASALMDQGQEYLDATRKKVEAKEMNS